MKKILFTALCLMMGTAAFAQEDEMVYPEDGNVVYSSSDRKISFDVASHFGLGFAHVTSEDFIPWKWHSGEFFLNLFKFKFAPCSWGGIEAGLDLGFISIRSASNAFYLDDNNYIRVDRFRDWDVEYDASGSTIANMSFGVPILLKGNFGHNTMGVGVNLQLSPSWGNTKYSIVQDNVTTDVTMAGAKITPFTYCIMATLSRKGLGFYYRYYPSKFAIVPEHAGSPKFGLMTMGIAMGF